MPLKKQANDSFLNSKEKMKYIILIIFGIFSFSCNNSENKKEKLINSELKIDSTKSILFDMHGYKIIKDTSYFCDGILIYESHDEFDSMHKSEYLIINFNVFKFGNSNLILKCKNKTYKFVYEDKCSGNKFITTKIDRRDSIFGKATIFHKKKKIICFNIEKNIKNSILLINPSADNYFISYKNFITYQ